jgi:hypothetical protein
MATLPTVADVRGCYPEVSKGASDATINEKIAEAASRVSATTWGIQYTRGVMLTTAHLLALTPEGAKMRLTGGRTFYEDELKRMRRLVACGAGRVG